MKDIELNLSSNNLGDKVENMKFLKCFMKFFPKNLQKLKVNISKNNLGGILENVRDLGDSIK